MKEYKIFEIDLTKTLAERDGWINEEAKGGWSLFNFAVDSTRQMIVLVFEKEKLTP